MNWNNEKRQQGKIISPVGFLKSFCSFLDEKILKLAPKMTKTQKFSVFQSFSAISVIVSTDFVDWNDENVHQGINALSSSLQR